MVNVNQLRHRYTGLLVGWELERSGAAEGVSWVVFEVLSTGSMGREL
jgi:hypothetical protein